MKRSSFLIALTASILCLQTAGAADKPRVLILGDSISIGYTPFVQTTLAEEMSVMRPMRGEKAENCSSTTAGVENIDRWLAIDGGKWDVIHFNWGLHDLKHVKADGKTVSDQAGDPPLNAVEIYEKNLREIVAKLKATGAKLIFATTTPVPNEPMKVYRKNSNVILYNEAALRVMKDNGIAVNDLYAFALPKLKDIQIQPANVHFTPEGSAVLGAEVVKAIRTALK
ncbi:SGNH/GDSL hydrolase family protein [Prosthecobacter sp. SYSU 5D2]|uniref:SGNH/GDSL hydrolase family protein n=1 Tax=Prosthecobacter sp. SYSU 5D2 TaxID=3134134 RepID=UPI0031FE5C93